MWEKRSNESIESKASLVKSPAQIFWCAILVLSHHCHERRLLPVKPCTHLCVRRDQHSGWLYRGSSTGVERSSHDMCSTPEFLNTTAVPSVWFQASLHADHCLDDHTVLSAWLEVLNGQGVLGGQKVHVTGHLELLISWCADTVISRTSVTFGLLDVRPADYLAHELVGAVHQGRRPVEGHGGRGG